MVRYEFGIMSSKWELKSDDMITAYLTMAIFIGKNIPVAVYSPQQYGFLPKDILEANKYTFNKKEVKECLKTIRKVE